MRRIIKIIASVVGITAATAALTFTTTTSAHAASDTPDDYWPQTGAYGSVMWNDYDSTYHDQDRDNVWVQDTWGDGVSVELEVYRDGELVASTHAYNGEQARVSFGNVANGESVQWEICAWDDGEPVDVMPGTGQWCREGTFYE